MTKCTLDLTHQAFFDQGASGMGRQKGVARRLLPPMHDIYMTSGRALPIIDKKVHLGFGNYLRGTCQKVRDYCSRASESVQLVELFIIRMRGTISSFPPGTNRT